MCDEGGRLTRANRRRSLGEFDRARVDDEVEGDIRVVERNDRAGFPLFLRLFLLVLGLLRRLGLGFLLVRLAREQVLDRANFALSLVARQGFAHVQDITVAGVGRVTTDGGFARLGDERVEVEAGVVLHRLREVRRDSL